MRYCTYCGISLDIDEFNEFENSCDACNDKIKDLLNVYGFSKKFILTLEYEFDTEILNIDYLGDNEWEIEGIEYLILTEKEADEKSKEYIEETVWAFNPSFLAGETGLPIEAFESIQKANICEGANEAFKAMIESTCGMDSFVETAISADGRGNFMNSYDGEEIEISFKNEHGEYEYYYAYRM